MQSVSASGFCKLVAKPKCRAEGADRFALFVAAAVLANNLMIIGELLTKRATRRRKAKRQ
jgi:hypothetical protein